MESNIFMGALCPKCNITLGKYSAIGGLTNCPNCNGEMIVAPEKMKVRNIANFSCECGFQTKILTSVGDSTKCPACEKKYNY